MENRICIIAAGLVFVSSVTLAQADSASGVSRPALSTGETSSSIQMGVPTANPEEASKVVLSGNDSAPAVPPVVARPSTPPISVITSEQGPLTIDNAIAIALQHNPGIEIAEEAYRRATGLVRENRGNRNLKLGIVGTYQRFDKVETAQIAPGQSIKIGEIDSRRATATLGVPIDISGTLGAGISASEFQQRVALMEFEGARQALALTVRQSYFNVLQTREQQTVASESVARYREQLRLANVRFDAGTAPKFDVLRAQTDLANAEQQQINAENSSRLAASVLASALGVTLPSPLVMTNPASEAKSIGSIEELVQEGLRKRPEAAADNAAVKAAQQGIKVARRGLRPSLNLALNYNYNGSTTLFQPRKFTSDALISMSIPIFDGGVTRGRVDEAKADLGSAKANEERTQLQIRLEVEQAVVSIDNARKRLSTSMTALDQAREALRLSQVRYESGVGTPLEVTDAEVAFTQAQTNVVNARYDVLLAHASLARATGEQSYAAD